jgi:hypothetical protein
MSKTPEWYVTEYPEECSFAVTDGYDIFAMICGGKTVGDECDLANRIAKLPDLERERDEALNERNELAGYLCRIKLPLSVRFVANLADVFPGKNVRMKDVDGYLCIFSVNVNMEAPNA